MIRKLFFAVAASVFLFSCKPDEQQIKQAETLDSMKLLLDDYEKKLLAVDTLQLKEIYSTIMGDLGTIQEALKDSSKRDTILKEDAIILSDYRSIRKVFSKFKEHRNGLLEELDYTRSQLASLSNDIKKSLVKKETANRFYLDEYKAAAELGVKIDERLKTVEQSVKRFNELEPQVKTIMEDYNYRKKQLVNE